MKMSQEQFDALLHYINLRADLGARPQEDDVDGAYEALEEAESLLVGNK